MSDEPIPGRLWCSYPDCHCDRENKGVCEFKHPKKIEGCQIMELPNGGSLTICGPFRGKLHRTDAIAKRVLSGKLCKTI
jgi:hypothetical protein